ncbi:cation diffusion facilitator family transporter [Streptomyces sp. SPB162]|uniref:cation diffusion facilitator family transporter n=1 Tax=Streptomyces sp. SPB162 TaxID=2940560 RepID=UPI0024071455|nr:cation diffusion facilitator family transporter [Streptomyces sp. SPB162]MDF9811017.1 cation diffusion facilitator family transporter [Streptomyces sp. SPB162]
MTQQSDKAAEAAGGSSGGDGETKGTILMALGANLVIAVAKAVGGLFAGSPALLSEAAHSVADSLNEVFLLASLKRSKRAADSEHPFGYGKDRFFWSLLAAVGIFTMGGCFSVFQGVEALRSSGEESHTGYLVGLGVLVVALLAEAASLAKALLQVRGQAREAGRGMLQQLRLAEDPALRTVLAEDSTAVIGVLLAIAGMALHMVTGQVQWEAGASLAIGVLLIYVAYRLGKDARGQLIGEAVDPGLQLRIRSFLAEQPEVDAVTSLLTMRLGMDSTLVAARVDLVGGLDSEEVEEVSGRIKAGMREKWPAADQVFLDITDASDEDRSRAGRDREFLDEAAAEHPAGR